MNSINKIKSLPQWVFRAFYLSLYDLITVNFAYFIVLWLHYNLRYTTIPLKYLQAYLSFVPVYSLFTLSVFYFLKLYKSIWKYVSLSEMNRILLATIVTAIFHGIGITVLCIRMPISYYLMGPLFQFMFTVSVRFAYRFINLVRRRKQRNEDVKYNSLIIGAGSAGQIIIKELENSSVVQSIPKCVIDDDPNKWGRMLGNIPIIGGREKIIEAVQKFDITQIIFTIPSASAKDKREILNICKETDCKLLTLPGVYQLLNEEVFLQHLKPVAVEDLLGREPIKADLGQIKKQIQGKVVLITGGGGSIGSELCRQIATYDPKQLIVFDIYENNAYSIEQELKRNYPNLNLKVLIGSVRDQKRVDDIFSSYRPDIVYHAAAHKHVPLMEGSPNEAVKNNVVGTYNTSKAALKYNAERFVLISTDKAVNPTNAMGASKRICEMIIQMMDKDSRNRKKRTQFVAVRFGNVLGSNGSVIPLFKKQIAAGGPVTVTHPDIIRYFMTISEAVGLVLQAGAYAAGGEIFVLDMGQPIKIDTLARNLIKLSGLHPDEDIEIKYIGLRPGEKLYEEKLMAEEGLQKTENQLIYIGKPIPFDEKKFLKDLQSLIQSSQENPKNIEAQMQKIVPNFKFQEVVG